MAEREVAQQSRRVSFWDTVYLAGYYYIIKNSLQLRD
jgi:hypothetical protein